MGRSDAKTKAAKSSPVESPMAKGANLPTMSGALVKGTEDALLAEARTRLREHERFTPGWEYHMGTILDLAIRKQIPVKEW